MCILEFCEEILSDLICLYSLHCQVWTDTTVVIVTQQTRNKLLCFIPEVCTSSACQLKSVKLQNNLRPFGWGICHKQEAGEDCVRVGGGRFNLLCGTESSPLAFCGKLKAKFVSRQGLTMYPLASWNSLCRPDWP